MKKTIVFLTALTLALLLAACGTEPEEDVEKTEGYVSPTDMAAKEETERPQAPPRRINGIGVYKTRVGGLYQMRPGDQYEFLDHIDLAGLVFPEAPAADIPAFVNPYPSNESGLMYDVTPEMLEDDLTRFLELLYGEWDAVKHPFQYTENIYYTYDREDNIEKTYTHKVPWVERDGMRISSFPGGVRVSMESDREDILGLLPNGDLRQSPLLAAALDYMGIDDPQVEYSVGYNSVNDQPRKYDYYIYQKVDDNRQETLNRLLSDIHIFYHAGSDAGPLFIIFGNESYPEISADPAVSLEQALEMVEEILPETAREDIKVRLSYNVRIREKYHIPCWELYVPCGCRNSDGVRLYCPLWVPVVDPAALK